MLLLPLGACQPRCSQMVWPSSARLSWGKRPTVSWMSAIWRRVRRLPRKVVDFRFWMQGVDGGARSHPKLSWQIRAKKSSPCAEKVCRDVNILGIRNLHYSLGASTRATGYRMPLAQVEC